MSSIKKQEDIEVLKKDLVEGEMKISNLKEKIKEKYVHMKSFSSISFKTEAVPEECSSSRNSCFHTIEHHISSHTNNPQTNKFYVEKPQAARTRKESSKHFTILKTPSSIAPHHTRMTSIHTVQNLTLSSLHSVVSQFLWKRLFTL